MKYAYAKFSSKLSNPFCSIAAPGLGNCLFPLARAIAFAHENNTHLITPEWFHLNIGPMLRGTKSRNCAGDFKPLSADVGGIEKVKALLKYPRYCECEWAYRGDYTLGDQNCVVEFSGMKDWFRPINQTRKVITEEVRARLARSCVKYDDYLGVHVRLGDFAVATREELYAGARNVRAPFSWYTDVIEQYLREGSYKGVVYFTDAKEAALSDLLEACPGEISVSQGPINDMFSLASTETIVGTRSTFALWAYFFSEAKLCLPLGHFQEASWLPQGRGIEYYR